MLPNGHLTVIQMAVRSLDHPLVNRYRKALVLGALREDVWYLPILGDTWQHMAFTHFYKPGLPGGILPFLTAGARRTANRFFARALREYRAGRVASAFVQLGRGNHVLADMLCPVHSQRTMHLTDPFEWWVEGHADELRALPVPGVPDGSRPSDLVEGLAQFAQAFPADRTNHLWGRLLWRLGLRERPDPSGLGHAARSLVPMGAAYTSAHLRMFLREARIAA